MPIFVVMGNLTEKGIKGLKDGAKRTKEVEALIKSLGGKLLGFYYTFGKYDWIAITEGPSLETAMKALMIFAQDGTSRTRTLVAMSDDEVDKIISEMP
jgi:uncharacterized protein with GYD domain